MCKTGGTRMAILANLGVALVLADLSLAAKGGKGGDKGGDADYAITDLGYRCYPCDISNANELGEAYVTGDFGVSGAGSDEWRDFQAGRQASPHHDRATTGFQSTPPGRSGDAADTPGEGQPHPGRSRCSCPHHGIGSHQA